MNLVSVRIITENIDSLINFYEQVTGIQAIQYTPDFAEIKTSTATLAIGSTRTLQFFGGEEVARAAKNQTAIIEFFIDDVEVVYERLKDYLSPYIVQEPTTMPWGNKSLLFRDPDGNLVNFFTPVSKESIDKFTPENN
ncbi:glyoxalase [Elizabethkingia miricola]|uniref:Glyoxalase n=1 Tax=Elizabethkingia miricola TaxID=172045 RepID=A0ABD4DR27_ELIMR|nr:MULTISPECIES: VOC family protein [Elizabethkingia]KUY20965.1 glyoxalase [Elizabethkingia miricola]MCL1654171.1 VOC family protein [Elizabethkingia miricola]OPC70697.1 glyoxalase [Elizabethkingia miricola]OPC74705.1 glyoxalase [Elizabethkingia miricola]QCO44879.1 glyoxalase/bleomycin resistance/dioxygenase family protein [Elizabethkingia sp. 2-6]